MNLADPADDDSQTAPGRSYSPQGVLQVRSGTPGAAGAIGDLVAALARAFAPQALTQRPQKVNQAIDEASGSPQTNDLGQQF
jgi:hypothetical protein